MKIFLLLSVLAFHSAVAINLNSDFITGFESGIFLRGKSHLIEEQYGCPRPAIKNQEMAKIQGMVAPMKMMAAMVPDKSIQKAISTIEVFLNDIQSLLSVFDGYSGGDFCQGMIFGMTGADMLTNIAQTAIQMKDLGKSMPQGLPKPNFFH